MCIFTAQHCQSSGLKVIAKASVENEEKRGHETSPRRLRGLRMMTPRHIHNRTIQRGLGMLPVPLSSCHAWERCCTPAEHCNAHSTIGSQRHLQKASWGGIADDSFPIGQDWMWQWHMPSLTTVSNCNEPNPFISLVFWDLELSNRCYAVQYI